MKPTFMAPNLMPENAREANAHMAGAPSPAAGDEFITMGDPSLEQPRPRVASTVLDSDILNDKILDEKIKADLDPRKPLKEIKQPKDLLKALISAGQYKKDVMLHDHMWTMRALEERDLLLAFDFLKEDYTSQMGRMTAVIFYQVVLSIEAVDGIQIYDWFEEVRAGDYKSNEEYKIAVKKLLSRYMERMAQSVIDQFYQEYTKIDGERNQAIIQLKN